MELQQVSSKEEWNEFILRSSEHTPLTQSFEWGEILKKEGKRVERLGIVHNGSMLGVLQVIYSSLGFGLNYAFCPKGPLFNKQLTINNEQRLYREILQYLKRKKCLFFRIEPTDLQVENFELPLKKTIDIEPRATLFLDLSKTEEELLTEMHQKTRYNIKVAERKNMEVRSEKDVDVFLELLRKTGSRDGFRLHEEKHYRSIFECTFTKQLSIFYQNQVIAIGVFIGYGNTFTYLYGASNYEFRNTMAPYLIQWEAIKLGKSLGYTYYDFYGVAPFEEENLQKEALVWKANEYRYNEQHKHAGFTRFKLGFGGIVEQNVGTWDVQLSSFTYRIYGLVRKIRRMI